MIFLVASLVPNGIEIELGVCLSTCVSSTALSFYSVFPLFASPFNISHARFQSGLVLFFLCVCLCTCVCSLEVILVCVNECSEIFVFWW